MEMSRGNLCSGKKASEIWRILWLTQLEWVDCAAILKKEKKSCPRKRRIEFVPIRWQWQEHKPCLFYDGGFISKEKKNVLAPGKSSLKCFCDTYFIFLNSVTLAFASLSPSLSRRCPSMFDVCLACRLQTMKQAWFFIFFFFAWKCCAHLNVCTTFSDHAAAAPPCSEMCGDELGSTQSCCWRECHSARALDVCFSCCQINKSWIFHDCLLPLR